MRTSNGLPHQWEDLVDILAAWAAPAHRDSRAGAAQHQAEAYASCVLVGRILLQSAIRAMHCARGDRAVGGEQPNPLVAFCACASSSAPRTWLGPRITHTTYLSQAETGSGLAEGVESGSGLLAHT
jgi:hypothetical protein